MQNEHKENGLLWWENVSRIAHIYICNIAYCNRIFTAESGSNPLSSTKKSPVNTGDFRLSEYE